MVYRACFFLMGQLARRQTVEAVGAGRRVQTAESFPSGRPVDLVALLLLFASLLFSRPGLSLSVRDLALRVDCLPAWAGREGNGGRRVEGIHEEGKSSITREGSPQSAPREGPKSSITSKPARRQVEFALEEDAAESSK